MINRDYQHSRPLDVHRWSDNSEANLFVDEIYNSHFWQINENKRIKKKHLKVILLDLYIAWMHDPDLSIAVHMSPSAYSDGTVFTKGKSRYNELNIKVSTIDIVHRLNGAGLIDMKDGWQDAGGRGFLTRIWPTSKLISLFQDAAMGLFQIGCSKSRETIILRDEEKNDLEYDDKPHINITPHSWRRLKTKGSERCIPLVGEALWAASKAIEGASASGFLFPRYNRNSSSNANSASAAVNKWLKPRVSQGCVIHSFRHSMRDRLRAVECPSDIIDAIGGWQTSGVGQRYGTGQPLEVKAKWMKMIDLC